MSRIGCYVCGLWACVVRQTGRHRDWFCLSCWFALRRAERPA